MSEILHFFHHVSFVCASYQQLVDLRPHSLLAVVFVFAIPCAPPSRCCENGKGCWETIVRDVSVEGVVDLQLRTKNDPNGGDTAGDLVLGGCSRWLRVTYKYFVLRGTVESPDFSEGEDSRD